MFGYYFIHHSVIVYAMRTAPVAWTAYEAYALPRYREQRGAGCYVPPNAAEAYSANQSVTPPTRDTMRRCSPYGSTRFCGERLSCT